MSLPGPVVDAMAEALKAAYDLGYDVGYGNGESSGYADWNFAFDGILPDDVNGVPLRAAAWVEQLMEDCGKADVAGN